MFMTVQNFNEMLTKLFPDMEQITEPRVSLEGFRPLIIAMEIVGAILIILVAVWCGSYRGGFAWNSNPTLEFNWHPLLMVIGFVFLYANGMFNDLRKLLRTLN